MKYLDENGLLYLVQKIKTWLGGKANSTHTHTTSDITDFSWDLSDYTNDAGFQTATDVSSAISSAISSTYKPSGSIAFANLPTLGESVLGNVYNITDAFTTTADFVEGANKSHPAGTNVAVVKVGNDYKFDVMAGFVDLSGYVETTDLVAITNAEIDIICA